MLAGSCRWGTIGTCKYENELVPNVEHVHWFTCICLHFYDIISQLPSTFSHLCHSLLWFSSIRHPSLFINLFIDFSTSLARQKNHPKHTNDGDIQVSFFHLKWTKFFPPERLPYFFPYVTLLWFLLRDDEVTKVWHSNYYY